uniref:hypothetical protein n=1 Tax=Altererythrobacter segetis TaxID=1104773 RepID=UPI001408EBEC|nr:hypothetical protein [Altererythrobacter segetis]
MNLPSFDLSLPSIDLSALPDLSHLTGLFGSIGHVVGSDDSIVILATFTYEAVPGGGGFL